MEVKQISEELKKVLKQIGKTQVLKTGNCQHAENSSVSGRVPQGINSVCLQQDITENIPDWGIAVGTRREMSSESRAEPGDVYFACFMSTSSE